MSLTIELRPELEAKLHEEAAKMGSDTNTFVVRSLEERLQRNSLQSLPPHLPGDEAVLLQRINQGLPESLWQEYHDLITRRRAETLTPEEHTRLIALSDSISDAHTKRMVSVAELARLRCVPLETLLDQVAIKPRQI